MAGSLAAQTRYITNASLAQYKDARLRADREYLENYERLGLLSPEEADRRIEQRTADMLELAKQLRADDLERDRLAAELVMNARTTAARNQQVVFGGSPFDDGFVYNGGFFDGGGFFYGTPFGGHHHSRFRFRRQFGQTGYVGGGQFWPTGPRTPPRPIFGPTRR